MYTAFVRLFWSPTEMAMVKGNTARECWNKAYRLAKFAYKHDTSKGKVTFHIMSKETADFVGKRFNIDAKGIEYTYE